MNVSELAIKHPYPVVAVTLLIAVMGVIGYLQTPVDLFPDTAPPQVVVITTQPGARADDVADNITEVIEKEINTISGLETVRSTSRDGVSSIVAEFDYAKDLGEAVLDVQSVIARVRGDLPADVSDPRIFRLTESTSRPLLTLALSPKPQSNRALRDIRLLAENQLTDRILGIDHIADVDVFGGYKPEVQVRVDRDKLAAHDLSIDQVVAALDRKNVSTPGGTIYTRDSEYLVSTDDQFERPEDIAALPIRRLEQGLLRVSDIATVELADAETRSLYHGNGRPAIAMGVVGAEEAPTVAAINNVKAALPELQADYPDIHFALPFTTSHPRVASSSICASSTSHSSRRSHLFRITTNGTSPMESTTPSWSRTAVSNVAFRVPSTTSM
jgi:multidrug efflux pump subunit AcrB